MTITSKLHLQNAGANADEVRRFIATAFADSEGVYAAGDLAVTQKSGTPDMSVDVAAGRILIKGTEATYQGTYFAENDNVLNVGIVAADATNPRKDLIILRVQDAVYSGATNDITIEAVTGTPAGSPVEPTLPANSFELAMIDVPANDPSIENAQITDRRVLLARTAEKWSTGRTITLTGDVTGTSPSFDGTANISITTSTPAAADMSDSDNAGRKISVTTTQPTSPTLGDLWLDTTP
jgi:hypothetical protein